jgi:predicted dehydrogenase
VIQDKPMSTRISECDRLVEAADRNKIKTLIWNRNMLPAVLHAKQLIDAGTIGRPYAIHTDFYFAKDAGPPKGTRSPQCPPLNWLDLQKAAHAEGADGGIGATAMGELQVEGIYPLAYMQLLTHATVVRVYARTVAMFHQGHFDNGVDDLASVSLEMSNGILGTLAIGRIGAASHPEIGEIKIHVLGTDGALVVAEARPEVAVYYRNQPEKEFPHRRVASDNDFLLTDSLAMAIDQDGES